MLEKKHKNTLIMNEKHEQKRKQDHWVVTYMEKAFGELYAHLVIFTGIVLFILVTVQLALLGAGVTTKHHHTWWWAIFALTLATGCSTAIDFFVCKSRGSAVTIFTVTFGSLATFFALGLWSRYPNDPWPTALIVTQCCANAVQLSAIFNQSRPHEVESKNHENPSDIFQRNHRITSLYKA